MKSTAISESRIIFETIDVFGKRIRTTREYWSKIVTQKHTDLIYDVKDVQLVLKKPDSVYRSVRDSTIAVFRKKLKQYTLVVLIKHQNGNGFVVTAYQTSKDKIKGEKLWPKS